MSKSRADFKKSTKQILASRVGYRCSFEGCDQSTIGPSNESAEAVAMVGEAAHIHSASSGQGARRVDESRTDEELRSLENGIWLCRHHHGLVDSDEATFTVEELRKYKADAEARAKARLFQEPKSVSVASGGSPGPTLVLTRPEARLLSVTRPRTAIELLNPAALALDLLGRSKELEFLRQWIGNESHISVHGVVGDAGMGKTRLAIELCRMARGTGWDAGFLDAREMDRFQDQQNLSDWGWSKPTLIVVDYAAARPDSLYTWLSALPRERETSERLRILLLERSADPNQGWWPRVFHRGSYADDAVIGLRHVPEPQRLGPIRDCEDRWQLFKAMCGRLGRDLKPEMQDYIRESLQHLTWGGHPLFVMTAAANMIDLGLKRTLALQPNAMTFRLAERELKRIESFAAGNRSLEKLLRHLAAFTTLCQGLTEDHLDAVICQEKEALGLDAAGDRSTVATRLRTALSTEDWAVRPLQPDLVGEAIVLMILNELSEAKAQEVVLRAAALARERVVPFAIRLVQDYATSSQDRAVSWVEALSRDLTETLDLARFTNQLPWTTVVLRSLSADLTGMLLERHRAEETNPAEFANICNSLAYRLGQLGRHEEALERASEAVAIYSALATKYSEEFWPSLTMSWNTLSNSLRQLGQNELAVEPIRRAVYLRQIMATKRPEIFRPILASSLSNLAGLLNDLGRLGEALEPALEAVELYRALEAERPGAFQPNLATSLGILANSLIGLGQHKEALESSEMEVDLLRALVAEKPEAFRPGLANTLNNSATFLSELERHEKALERNREAVKLNRLLSVEHPEAFQEQLAGSLCCSAVLLTRLGHNQEAFRRAKESVELFRDLCTERPETFRYKLAASLGALATISGELGNYEEALKTTVEEIELRRALAAEQPKRFPIELMYSLEYQVWLLSILGRRTEAFELARELDEKIR